MRSRVLAGALGIILLVFSGLSATAQQAIEHVQKGDELLRRGQFEEAIAALSAGIEIDPTIASAHLLLGIAYGNTKNFEASRKHLQNAVALEPDNPIAVFLVAQEFASTGAYDQAWLFARKAETLGFAGASALLEELKKRSAEPEPGSVAMQVFKAPEPRSGTPPIEAAKPARPVMKPVAAEKIKGKPKRVASINAADTQYTYPITLCWSPDDTQLAIQSQRVRVDPEGERWVDPSHKIHPQVFVVDVATGAIEPAQGLPAWAAPYWSRKAAEKSEGGTLEIKEQADSKYGVEGYHEYVIGNEVVGRYWQDGLRGTNVVEPGRGGPIGAQQTSVRSELPRDDAQFLGESGDSPSLWHLLYGGLTYSWAPSAGEALVYCNDGAVKVIDGQGNTRRLARGNLFLPAWSNDGTRIAFVEVPLTTQNWTVHVAKLQGIESAE